MVATKKKKRKGKKKKKKITLSNTDSRSAGEHNAVLSAKIRAGATCKFLNDERAKRAIDAVISTVVWFEVRWTKKK